MKSLRNTQGLTIPELVIAMAILAILATIGFISFVNYNSQARDTVRVSDIKNITKILDLHKLNTGNFPIPSDSTDIVYSGAVVWTQGVFGEASKIETGKIFGDLQDPLYKNEYTYSTTSNRREYQLSALFESEEQTAALVSFNPYNLDIVPTTYAATPFSPDELNPAIWLDAEDIDGDGDTTDNPSDGTAIVTWVNKSAAGAANNPTITNGTIQYTSNGYYGSYPGVFISNGDGVRLENSDITSGDIFYVVQKNDPFGSTDSSGYGLYSTASTDYLIGYKDNRRNALKIGNSPDHSSNAPSTTNSRTAPYIYSFHTDDSNYSFRDTGNIISQGGTNSISGVTWAFNRAGAVSNKNSDLVVSEILIFDSLLSQGEREKVEGYLAHKWGQDYFLPNSHPYKDAPPESAGPPPPPDTTPDAFVLNDVTNATLSTAYISNAIAVSGINTQTSISIVNGEYNINGSAYTSGAGNVSLGDDITVRLVSATGSSTTTSATLTIGGVSEVFSVTTFVADTTPDDFSFSPVTDADTSTQYTSNPITISGLNTPVSISISGVGAQYKVIDGVPVDATGLGTASANASYPGNNPVDAFDNDTSITGWGNNGSLPAILVYDFGSGNAENITKYTLYRSSNQSGGWNSWKYSPKNWTFEGSNNGTSWTILDTRTNENIAVDATKKQFAFTNTSNYRFYRINISSTAQNNNSWVNITEMELINEGTGTFTSNPSGVENGDTVLVRTTSSSAPGTLVTASLTVGSMTQDFDVTTVAADTTPDSFNFIDVSSASLSTVYESNTQTITGINTATPISISGAGEYKINAGSYTSSSGNIQNGDTVRVRQTSSNSNSVTVSSTLNIGGVTNTYNVTTPAPPPDTTPDSFTFIDVTGANVNTQYTSNSITITGINTPTPLSISGGQYDKNNSNSYSSASTTVVSGDVISVRRNSHSLPGNTVNVTLTVGGVSDVFSITTVAPDTTPDPYVLGFVSDAITDKTYNSNPIIVSGINTGTPIDISGGGGKYSINGGAFTSGAGTVYNGDEVIVHMQSLGSGNSNVNTTLNIGGVTAQFNITTIIDDTVPDVFTFSDVQDANLNAQYISSVITITGINSPTDISIVGGEYRIGATGNFTSLAGIINNNEEVTVRLVSSSTALTTQSATLNVGGVTDSFDVTTKQFASSSNTNSSVPASNIYVTGRYNGLISYAFTGSTHYVLATPSIIAYDTTNPNFSDIIRDKKLVYKGFNNIPASYAGNNLTMSGGFDFLISDPVLYEGSKEDLGSYGGLKQIDEGIRSTYGNFQGYQNVASYLDDYSLGYLEKIIGESIGINPIKPYYCSDILRSKLIYNIAPLATVTASPSAYNSYGTGGISNGIKDTTGDLDYEYHSADGNATIQFEWAQSQKIGFIRIYNRTGCCSDRLSGANIKLYNSIGGLIYSHSLWDTTNDYVVDLDLEGIGQLHHVNKLTIESVGGNYLNLREVEIFLGGDVIDGTYKVDKDGLGGQSPYNVYCDMTTDGGGWTRIGDDYITNGNFSGQDHVGEFTFNDYDNPSDNVIVSQVTQAPPIYTPDAFVLRHNGSAGESYEMYFDDIPGEYFAQEIRLSAWVKGTSSSIFDNTIVYEDASVSNTTPEYEILDSDGAWQYHIVRIPLTGLVDNFTWNLGDGINGPFYVTGLKMEIYYK